MEYDKEFLVGLYRTMLKIRLFEEKTAEVFSEGRIHGAVHLYIGEEAVATGACAALRPDDYITSTHRGHGHCLAKGGQPDRMMAEIFGKATGYCKGKGGSMHIADLDVGILGANGIVGGGIPIAVGAALGTRIKKEDRVTLCFFGDGASNTGSFHESLNLASVLQLPVVFVCENNQWAVSTPARYSLRVENVADRAVSYAMPGVVVDGNDPLAVYEAVHEAVERARGGGGPTLIEAKTYRWEGHYRGDPETYRSREEVREWREKRDPIKLFGEKLKREGILTDEEATTIRAETEKLIEDAVRFAEESPLPSLDLLYADLYA